MVMRKYLTVALLITVAIGPASALDIGVGVSVGGTGVSAGVRTGKNGTSAGVSTSVGGRGGAKAGTAAGKSGGSSIGASGNLGGIGVGAGVGVGKNGTSAGIGAGIGGAKAGASVGTSGGSSIRASGNVGRASGGVSTGSVPGAGLSGTGPGNAPSGLAARSGSPATGTASRILGAAPEKGVRPSIALPRILWPLKSRRRHERGEWSYPLRFPAPIAAITGTPRAVVRVCRQAIAQAASALGGVRVRAVSAGPLHRGRRGTLTAPLDVRIDYAGQGGREVRQARIRCRLDTSGRVIAVI
ncbi:helicase [Sinorhizobium meliloti]|uniref:Helicase n=2 Tax=Rhizobium meliloti TaxID=382 RepID=F7XCQ7_SINMM|nr:conserved hypothetical protein [Sinorhizobium meliloti SM11]ARS67034.1 helicase [Sinorhizobium meliloti RU11/001]RVG63041.1 helicase [Sinorhizobium meliloti]RVG99446.1 helicase [Sinorhizobium meliloti]RVH57705.1 helicase [Sinorhizobium meliloti]